MEKSMSNKGKATATPEIAVDGQPDKPRRHKSLSTLGRLFRQSSRSSRKKKEDQLDPNLSCRGNGEYGSVIQVSLRRFRDQHSSGHLGRSGPPEPYRHPSQPYQEGFSLANSGDEEEEEDGGDDDDDSDEEGGEEEEQADPGLLGSVDYHNFLNGSSGGKAKFAWDPTAAALPSASIHTPSLRTTRLDYSTAQTALRLQPSRESSNSGPSHPNTLQNLRSKKYLSLGERRSQRLIKQFASPDPQPPTTPTRVHHKQSSISSLSSESVVLSRSRPESRSYSQSQSQRLAEQVAFLGTPRAGRHNQLSCLTQFFTTQSFDGPTDVSAAALAAWPTQPLTPNPSPYPVPIPPIPKAYRSAPYSSPSAPFSQLTPASIRGRGALGTVSRKDLDSERLKPFNGPLPPQQPPPQQPLPRLPRLLDNNILSLDLDLGINMTKSTKGKSKTEEGFSLRSQSQDPFRVTTPTSARQRLFGLGSKDKSSIDTDENLGPTGENGSSKEMHHGLRSKVSKLFGDERPSRDSGTTSTPAPIPGYRPISLTSHDSERVSFSDLFSDVLNVGRLSTGSGGPSQRSANGDVSRASSGVLGEMYDLGSTSFDSGGPRGSGPAQIDTPDSNDVSRGPIPSLSREITGDTPSRDPYDSSGKSLDARRSSVSDQASHTSALASMKFGRASEPSTFQEALAGRRSSQTRRDGISCQPAHSRDEIAQALASRLGLSDEKSRKAILETYSAIGPPPLTQHPSLRGDLPLQARSELLDFSDNHAAVTIQLPRGTLASYAARNQTEGLHVSPLNINRQRAPNQAQPGQRPTQVALSTRNVSRSTPAVVDPLTGFLSRSLATVPDVTAGKDPETDVDIGHPFDRTVDVTWYRFAQRESETSRVSFLPYVDNMFSHVSSAFTARLFRGRMTSRYDHMRRRFPYFNFDADIRFKIMQKLLEDYLPGKPVLLNGKRAVMDAWPAGVFVTLRDVLGPLQDYLIACPRLRADVMVALFMRQAFHVVFDPFTKGETSPLATKWLFKYLYYMQDVRVELDLTKLGFGPDWEATFLSTRLWDVGNLVHVFVEEMLQRDGRENPMGQLTIFCRRYFGYRQGRNPFVLDTSFYKDIPAGGEDEHKPPSHIDGTPWNYNQASTSLPPSANNPYSGHRRHHAAGPGRVPYAHECHMSIANVFLRLAGRVWSVRMCGLSENWVRDNHARFWPEDEFAAIPDKSIHIDRYTPSKHDHAATGHGVYLDYGIRIGIHRFPPLRDSEPMVCIPYDLDQDCFVEVGSGNILTVLENGVEVISRATHPPLPRSDLPRPGGPAVHLSGVRGFPPRSRIPSPAGRAMTPVMRAMRESTPRRTYKLLGLGSGSAAGSVATVVSRGSGSAHDSGESLVTPTRPRVSTAASAQRQVSDGLLEAVEDQLGELVGQRSRSATVIDGAKPRVLATKKSFLSLMGGDRRKPGK